VQPAFRCAAGLVAGNGDGHDFLVIVEGPLDGGSNPEGADHPKGILVGAAAQERRGAGDRARARGRRRSEQLSAPVLRPGAQRVRVIAGQQQLDFPRVRRDLAEIGRYYL
jgi:hypothetical protein